MFKALQVLFMRWLPVCSFRSLMILILLLPLAKVACAYQKEESSFISQGRGRVSTCGLVEYVEVFPKLIKYVGVFLKPIKYIEALPRFIEYIGVLPKPIAFFHEGSKKPPRWNLHQI